jgi:DNA-binding CsgD family transcriptional regulator
MPGSRIQRSPGILRGTRCDVGHLAQRTFAHRRRIGLSAKKRQLLQVAAVLGPTFALRELAELLHQPVASLLPTIEGLLAAGVITSGDQTFAFRDTSVWQEVVSAIPRPILHTLREEAAAIPRDIARPRPNEAPVAMARTGERRTVASTVMISNLRWNQGFPAESIALGREAVAAVGELTPFSSGISARLAMACKLICLRELEEAGTLISMARLDTVGHGFPEQSALRVVDALSLMPQGRVKEATAGAALVLRVPDNAADLDCCQVARAVLALAALRGGDLTAAKAQVRHFTPPRIGQDSSFPVAYLEWVAFLTASERCDPADALDTAATRFPELIERRVLWYEEPAAAPWLIRLALDSGDRRLAAKIADRVSRVATEMPQAPTIAAVSAHSQALVDGNMQGLEHAAAAHRDLWCAGLAAEDLAVRQLERGEKAHSAGQWLESALRRFTALGASRDIERVRKRLKQFSVRQTVGRASPSDQWKDLTQVQRKVARLVSQGLNNRQIAESIHISPHTVNYHLRRIYQRLDISSRVELARITPSAGLRQIITARDAEGVPGGRGEEPDTADGKKRLGVELK